MSCGQGEPAPEPLAFVGKCAHSSRYIDWAVGDAGPDATIPDATLLLVNRVSAYSLMLRDGAVTAFFALAL